MKGNFPVRFGERGGETHQPHGWKVRPASTLRTGGLLLAAYHHATPEQVDQRQPKLFGQEIAPHTAALARINILLHQAPAVIATGDTLMMPQFLDGDTIRRFEAIVTNPPFGLRGDRYYREQLQHDPYSRFLYGPPTSTADVAFVQHVVASLNHTGRAALLVPPHILFASGHEVHIRRWLIERDILEAVVSLPANLLLNASITT